MEEHNKAAVRFRNISAYWRARAAKSQNPEVQQRLEATAAHYEELARGAQSPLHYLFSYAPRQRLILIDVGKILNANIYLDVYDASVRFIASRGPCSLILDLSRVEHCNISSKFAFAIATRKSAIPPSMSRLVVAPQPQVYEVCRSVEHLRSSTPAPIIVVRQTGDAFAHFAVSRSDFREIEPLQSGSAMQ